MLSKTEALIEARSLLEKPENWIQGVWHEGEAYCMLGAVRQVLFDAKISAKTYSLTIHELEMQAGEQLAVWNDRKWRRHEDVLTVFDKAIARSQLPWYKRVFS